MMRDRNIVGRVVSPVLEKITRTARSPGPTSHCGSGVRYYRLWSAFNFWNIPGIDSRDYGWTDQEQNYGSPELFHELIVSHKSTKWGKYTFDYYHDFTIRSPRKLLGMFGPANVLFLRNEDLLPAVVDQPGGLLDQLVNFTGLHRTGFKPTEYLGLTNCNDQRGMRQTCEGLSSKSSSYAMAGIIILFIYLPPCCLLQQWRLFSLRGRHD
jgi:hypothetical protein